MENKLSFGSIILDTRTYSVYIDGTETTFTTKEFKLLECFLRHPRIAITRQELTDWAWGHGATTRSNTLDVHIKNIRRKITSSSDGSTPSVRIQVLRGVGYRLV